MSEIGYGSKNMSITEYRRMKTRILKREFMIPLTKSEEEHINELETEYAIDRYARTLILKYWE